MKPEATPVSPALADLRKLIVRKSVPSPIQIHTVNLDEELSTEFLKHNLEINLPGRKSSLKNRESSEKNIDYLSNCIQNDLMLNTGEPIIFTIDGYGIDLAHRCKAVLKAKKGYITTVLTGLPVAANELVNTLLVMGTASKRTPKQLAKFAGVEMALWDTVKYYSLPDDTKSGTMDTAISKLELNQDLKANPQYFQKGLQFVQELFKADPDNIEDLGRNRVPVYAAAYLKMADINKTAAQEFMAAFLDKKNVSTNPMSTLRIELRVAFNTLWRDRTKPFLVRGVMLRAFNDYLEFRKANVVQRWDYRLLSKKKKAKKGKKVAA